MICDGCGETRDLAEVRKALRPLPECCYISLRALATAAAGAYVAQRLLLSVEAERVKMTEIADQAIVSNDPKVRAAAFRYRRKLAENRNADEGTES